MIFITLLLLKVFGIINWGWWLITMPLWLIPALFIIGIAICAIIEYPWRD